VDVLGVHGEVSCRARINWSWIFCQVAT